MSDRPTPETDTETMRDEYDHVDTDFGPFAPSDTVPAEFARQLERERDEANDKMVSAECDVREIASAMEKVKQERDYVREAFVIAVDEMVRAQCRTREAIRERDLLKDILRELLDIIPEPECHDFGHTKEERHSMFETCPVMERYDGLIEQARRAAK